VQETEDWVVYNTGTPAQAGTPTATWRSGDDTVWSVPVVPGMTVHVNGRNVPYRVLEGVLPRFTAAEGATVEFHYRLPHQGIVIVLMALGLVMLGWLVVRSARRTT
jgi:hypothetical protein